MPKFPMDVPDKTIFEASPDIFYQFNESEKSWIKVDGFNVSMDLATPLKDGLMSSDDLRKLQGLLLPPPNSAMSAKSCSFTFDSGTFGFRSSQNHLNIDHELTLIDKDEKGFNVERKEVWQIHENTYGINFGVNLDTFIRELENRESLVYKKTMGPQGPKGDSGKDGIDELETGPKGRTGTDGANTSFPGFLATEDRGFLEGDGNRAIVDVTMEPISQDENFIVVTRANIGNPELCPKFIRPKKINSKWLLVIDERPPVRILIEECSPLICGVTKCAPDAAKTVIRTFCSTRLYYLDFQPIETIIRNRFDELLQELKQTKELITEELLKSMIDLFTEQKLAICCALENCESRRENQRHRNIIDGERIQGAQAGFSIEVDGEDVRNYQDTDPDKDCQDEAEDQAGENEQDVATGETQSPETCLRVTGSNNTTERSATLELEAGTYMVTVRAGALAQGEVGCCFYTGIGMAENVYKALIDDPAKVGPGMEGLFPRMTPYNGRMAFFYLKDGVEVRVDTPNTGNFRTRGQCEPPSCGFTFEFTHDGGPVRGIYTGGDDERIKFANATISIPATGSQRVALEAAARAAAAEAAIQAARDQIAEFGVRLAGVPVLPPGTPTTTPIPPTLTVEIPFRGSFSDEGIMEFCIVGAEEPEPEPTMPLREMCDSGYENQLALDAKTNSVQVSEQDIEIDETPREFTLASDEIFENQGGRFLRFNLPKTGTYQIEFIDGAFYDAQIVNGEFGRFCPEGCVIINDTTGAKAIVGSDNRIPPGWTVQPDPDGILPPIEERFVSGFLVTMEMYDAAIQNDSETFYQVLIDSGTFINVAADPLYDGLQNSLVPDEVSLDTEQLMADIRTKIRGYTGLTTFLYKGFKERSDVEAMSLIQSLPPLGSFLTALEANEIYFGQFVQITTATTELDIFFKDNSKYNGLRQPQFTQNRGSVSLRVRCVDNIAAECDEPLFKSKIDCRFRDRETNALIVNLPPGTFVMTVTDCCCFGNEGFHGKIIARYNAIGGDVVTLTNPDVGSFPDDVEASNNYLGNSFGFQHIGGDVKIWIPQSNRQGIMEVEIQKQECFDLVGPDINTSMTAPEDAVESDPSFTGEFVPCDMSLEHLNFYEVGWKSKACCGAFLEAGGTKWIVVFRSLGADSSCGGGESEDTDCIRHGLNIGVHPAIAFPTLDGKLFLGKPTSFQRFFRDINLEATILGNIIAGDVFESVNNPGDVIKAIIFPQN